MNYELRIMNYSFLSLLNMFKVFVQKKRLVFTDGPLQEN